MYSTLRMVCCELRRSFTMYERARLFGVLVPYLGV